MELMLDKLEKILMPLAEAIGRNKYLISIRDGFLVSTPLLIAGSLFLLIANFPVPGWPEFLESIEMGNGMTLATFLSKPSDATFTIMAIFATMGIAYSYAKQIDTDRIFGAATALMSWFLLMPYVVDGTVTVGGKDVTASMSGIPLGWVGAKGIFVGIIIAFTSVALYAWVKRRGWVIKMPAGVPPTVVESFSALIPIMVTMGVFFLINTVFGMFGTDVFDIIFVWLQTPLLGLGDTLGAMVIAYVFLHLFWFFGINGSSVVSYLAMAAGFVPICNGIQIPWTMPLGISGFFATNWVGALLQSALLVLGVFLYMPFIKMMDKQYLSDEQKAIETPIEEDDIDLDDLSFDDL